MKSIIITGDLSQAMRFLKKLSIYRHPIMRDRYSIYDELVPIKYLPIEVLSKFILADHAAIILAQNTEANDNSERMSHVEPMCLGRLHVFEETSVEPLIFTQKIVCKLNTASESSRKPWYFWHRQISTITPTSVSTRFHLAKW